MIKYIHHISDIHIRMLKRHDEFRQVFDNLYAKIEENSENSIIVLTGDIVHSKLEISPELIDLVSEFFTNLAKITKVLIIPGNHDCYTPGHQILTSTGWVNIEDYVNEGMQHPVATFNQITRECEFQIPTAYIKKYYEDDVYNLVGKDCDMTVTKTHQVLYTHSSTKKFYKNIAEKLPKKCLIPINSITTTLEEDLYYNLLGFTFAESTFLSASDKNKKIHFHLKNKREIEYLSNILKKLNYKFNVCEQRDGTVYIRIYSDLARKIYAFFDGKKEIPITIFNSSIIQLKSFVMGYLNGDGNKNRNFWRFTSISKSSIDKLYTIFRLIGATSHVSNKIIFGNYKNSKQQYLCTGNINNVVNNTVIYNKSKKYYSGYVYCVSVPNTNLFIRNNNKIYISGNCNLSNLSRLDTLSPIIENLNNNNIVYSKNTETIIIDNLKFIHQSIFTNKEAYINPLQDDFDKTKIALYHGVVNGANFGVFNVKDCETEPSDFDGFDIVLLGDVHECQKIQARDKLKNKPEMWYAGSLIQSNFGESHLKGYLLWDVEKQTPTFIPIKNEYGFYTINIKDGICEGVDNISSKPRLRLLVSDTTVADIQRISTDFRKKYDVQQIIVNNVDADKNINKLSKSHFTVDVRNIKTQNNLIKEHLRTAYEITDASIITKICDINEQVNKALTQSEVSKNVLWIPKKFEFSNMFSYGEDNIIDFSKLENVVGLLGKNAEGKSAVIDSLTFCIFDKCARAYKGSNILNNNKSSFYCKFNFEIDGVDFFIERVGTRQKNGSVKVNVKFWTIADDGGNLILSGINRDETNQNIRSYLGTYDDFVSTALSFQGNNNSFIEKSQSERKEFLAKFLDIDIFDMLYDIANEKTKEFNILFNEYKKHDFSTKLSNLELELSNTQLLLKKYESQKYNIEAEEKTINEEIIRTAGMRIPTSSNFIDKKKLEASINTNQLIVDNLDMQVDDLTEKIFNYKTEAVNLFNKLKSMEVPDIEEKYNYYKNLKEAVSQKINSFDTQSIKIEQMKKTLQDLEEHQYDPNCFYCMNNIFVKQAIKTKADLDVEIGEFDALKKEIAIEQENILSLSYVDQTYNELQIIKKQLDEKKMMALKTDAEKNNICNEINRLRADIKDSMEQISIYEKNKIDIEHNSKIDGEIENFKNKLSTVLSNKVVVEQAFQDTMVKLGVLHSDIDKIHTLMANAKEMEEKYTSYELYTRAVSKDGVPYDLIANTIPILEEEVNDILAQIVDFTIIFNLDGKNINAYIAYDDTQYWPIELVSGMEKFVSGLAIRCALMNISNLPRPTFLAIDEGFGVLDAENINSLSYLFNYLKQIFDFVLIVSHLDTMKDMVDTIINISKDDGVSKITLR